MPELSPLFQSVEAFLRDEVSPRAERIDDDPEALRDALHGLARLDALALKRPAAYGGPDATDQEIRWFQETVARYSGALAFLQTQHQGVSGMIANGGNLALRDEYLPQMGDGRKLVGVGFSQLRRPGPPIMRAERTDGGYRLNGHVPWITGWDYFGEFVIGAALPDGQSVFALMPLRDQGDSLRLSPPMRLAAMSSANTVSAEVHDFFLSEERVILVREAGWIQNNDQINIAQQGSFALGCARAGLDIVFRNAERRKIASAAEAFAILDAELTECQRLTELSRQNLSDETTQERLDLRARQIELAVRCAHAAVASSSGAANSIDHPAQRVYREALVFTVSAQTGPVMDATLRRIAARP